MKTPIANPIWRAVRVAFPPGILRPNYSAIPGAPPVIFSGDDLLIHPPRWRALPFGPEKPTEEQP